MIVQDIKITGDFRNDDGIRVSSNTAAKSCMPDVTAEYFKDYNAPMGVGRCF